MASHQLENEGPLNGLSGSSAELKVHHPFESALLDPHQSHLPQAVLELLRQGAAGTHTSRWPDLNQSGCIGLPTQLNPDHALQGSEPELNCQWVRLLGFFKATRQQGRPQVTQHSPECGEIHHLKRC